MKPLLLLALGLTLTLPAFADRRDDDDRRGRRGGRVILFEDAEYRGGALVLYAGESIENFSGMTFENGAKLNDRVSSIRVEGDVEVYVYENARFRGDALRLTESARDLTGRLVSGGVNVSWNDRISSIRVVAVRGRGNGNGNGDWGRDRDNGRPNDGPRVFDPEKAVKSVFKDLLARDPNPGELRNFADRLRDGRWTERMLREYLQTEERYQTEIADRLIRRAYLDVLGREADESGLRTYRRRMVRDHWTDSDVRDDLRKSAEYRSKHR